MLLPLNDHSEDRCSKTTHLYTVYQVGYPISGSQIKASQPLFSIPYPRIIDSPPYQDFGIEKLLKILVIK